MSLLDVQEAFDRAQQPEIVLAAFKVEVCRREVTQRTPAPAPSDPPNFVR